MRRAALALGEAARQCGLAADSLDAGLSATAEACVAAVGEQLDSAYDVVCGPAVAVGADTCDCHRGGICRVCGRAIGSAVSSAAAYLDTMDDARPLNELPEYRKAYGLE